jgi:hypothetical protein
MSLWFLEKRGGMIYGKERKQREAMKRRFFSLQKRCG